ncbi:hypothetical protein KR222_005392 [Zaprionus bogoriensis]|nr:hypothetical protein KR222_005392 [Zaprionus bogoriensis]
MDSEPTTTAISGRVLQPRDDPLHNWSQILNALPDYVPQSQSQSQQQQQQQPRRSPLLRYQQRHRRAGFRHRQMAGQTLAAAPAVVRRRGRNRRRNCGKCFALLHQNRRMRRLVRRLKNKAKRSS